MTLSNSGLLSCSYVFFHSFMQLATHLLGGKKTLSAFIDNNAGLRGLVEKEALKKLGSNLTRLAPFSFSI